jgi:hypothetical protein
MFHSIPAALTFAGLAFLISGPAYDEHVRYLKAGGVFFGVMSHLFLDELYSIEWKGGSWRLKRSSGTALKLWGKNGWANFSCYAKLVAVGVMVAGESSVMNYLEARYPELAGKVQRIHHAQESLIGNVRDGVLPDAAHAPTDASAGNSPPAVAQPFGSPSDWTATPIRPGNTDPWPLPARPSPSATDGFTPNAGRLNMGSTQPVYRADSSGFAPR